jgi:hypothetical protein
VKTDNRQLLYVDTIEIEGSRAHYSRRLLNCLLLSSARCSTVSLIDVCYIATRGLSTKEGYDQCMSRVGIVVFQLLYYLLVVICETVV